ncbi:transposase [Sphingobacterium hungaricum]|uniref:Transposase n=1 Tax=Sphingobacterium hungaricum TaxID=2082723 RepID=A0A928V178_9SPHI|nr:transposase [Sphingobacterium hungaricum]MBE8714632.1 transposase [Sphingobacterium hungaricum]
MKKIYLVPVLLAGVLVSCQNKKEAEDKKLADQAIAIHDEIMPQISSFDKATIEIDSILLNLNAIKVANPELDTTTTRTELTSLKVNLEAATDNMMIWMKDYSLDSTDVAYQQAEVDNVTAMKKQFDDVSKESETKLSPFRK